MLSYSSPALLPTPLCSPLHVRVVARDLQNKLFGPLANGFEGTAQFWPERVRNRRERGKGRGTERGTERRSREIDCKIDGKTLLYARTLHTLQPDLLSLSLSLWGESTNNFSSSFQTIFIRTLSPDFGEYPVYSVKMKIYCCF